MSIAQKFDKVAPHSKQPCPLCGHDKILVANGLVDMGKEFKMVPDRGYSFCNCKNIWYTDWSNVDLRSRHKNESIDALHFYLYNIRVRMSDERNNNHELIDPPICNRGYKKNKVLVTGDAPKTVDEFNRLGFVVEQENGPWDLIWAYHSFEHFHKPLESLEFYFSNLNEGGTMFVAMPDPYFIEFDNPYTWQHWLLREHYIMWDMDSFCDEAEKVGFRTVHKIRNTEPKALPNKDMHLIFTK